MRRTAFAYLLAAGLAAGAAQAQAPLDGSSLAPGGGFVVGGGGATISGGGDDMSIAYSTGGAGGGGNPFTQPGRSARFAGGYGDGLEVEYSAPEPLTAAGAGTGREAWLRGGGDNAEVVYGEPR